MEKQTGAGSVWNPNSWHWEMKNYNQKSKALLQQKFLELTFQAAKDFKIKHTNIKFIKSDAQVNIRKGKQILVYQFQLELTVNGDHQSEDNSEGSYRVRQVLNDDLQDMIIDQVKATQKNKVGIELKNWIKKNAKPIIVKLFKQFQEEIMKIQSDPAKLEQDKKKREELLVATKKARQQNGAEKQRLLQEQKAKQKKAKQQAYKKLVQAKTNETK